MWKLIAEFTQRQHEIIGLGTEGMQLQIHIWWKLWRIRGAVENEFERVMTLALDTGSGSKYTK